MKLFHKNSQSEKEKIILYEKQKRIGLDPVFQYRRYV